MDAKKVCARCRQVLPCTSFGVKRDNKRDGLQSLCKVCNSEQAKEYYHKKSLTTIYAGRAKDRKSRIKDALSEIKAAVGCLFCGEKTSVCLDYHHVDQNDKEVTLSNYSSSVSVLLVEIEKCEVLCANCHRKVHAGLLDVDSRRPYCIEPLLGLKRSLKKGRQRLS